MVADEKPGGTVRVPGSRRRGAVWLCLGEQVRLRRAQPAASAIPPASSRIAAAPAALSPPVRRQAVGFGSAPPVTGLMLQQLGEHLTGHRYPLPRPRTGRPSAAPRRDAPPTGRGDRRVHADRVGFAQQARLVQPVLAHSDRARNRAPGPAHLAARPASPGAVTRGVPALAGVDGLGELGWPRSGWRRWW
jgi:hypothetical protein